MKAIVIAASGGPETLVLRDVPRPTPPPGHVRVRVRAAGVNRADVLQRRGTYAAPKGVPSDIPGLEYAGVIDALGEGVEGVRPGERVYGIVAGGAYAEYLVVHAREVVAAPSSCDDVATAALPEAFITAYDAAVTQGHLAPGERLLVHAAGSGVGTAAVQIGRALGATVVGTSRTPDKLARLAPFGLDAGVMTAGDEPFADRVRAAFGGHGADVVLDLVGGPRFAETLACCAPRARVLVVGLTAGPRASIEFGPLLHARLTVIGTVLRARPLEEKIAAASLLARHLTPLFERGLLRPVVDKVFRLEDAPAAHTYLESNQSFGKVVLTLD